MTTTFAHSPDRLRIAYDRADSGPAVLLPYGGGSNREAWHEFGYVGRLSKEYTVIAPDLRCPALWLVGSEGKAGLHAIVAARQQRLAPDWASLLTSE